MLRESGLRIGEHTACSIVDCRCAGAAGGPGLADIAVVDVAGQERHRGRSPAPLPRRDLHRLARHVLEAAAGRRPSARGRPSCRIFSPNRPPRSPQAPRPSASLKASRWCSPRASRNGSDVPMRRWSTSPRSCSSSQAASSASSRAARRGRAGGPPASRRRPGGPGCRSRACSSTGRWRAPGRPARRRRRGGHRGRARRRPACASTWCADLVLGPLGRGEVAEVLVDPVRRQPGDDPPVPPRRGLHLLAPLLRGVPVVADVVVVEDHRARHRREQPAVGGVGPGEAVEVGVLLVVLELGPRRLLDVAAGLDEGLHLLGGLVGVDLVAEEQQQVGQPLDREVRVVRIGRLHLVRRPAGPTPGEHRRRGSCCPPRRGSPTYDTSRSPSGADAPGSSVAMTGCRERRAGLGPDALARRCRRCRPRPSPARGRTARPGRSGARARRTSARSAVSSPRRTVTVAGVAGLDPDRGRRVVDVAQQGPQEERAVGVAHGWRSTLIARRSSIAR